MRCRTAGERLRAVRSRREAPDKLADPIIVHPDVRRTMLSIRACNEPGAAAFVMWTALTEE